MARQRHAHPLQSPYAFGSFLNWLKLLRENKHIDRRYIPRALMVTLVSLLTSPLRLYESLRYGATVRRTAVHPSPIFIIGHWRSGATHLHNLLVHDKNLSFVSTWQAMAPGWCLIDERLLQNPLNKMFKKWHPTREVDNIPFSLDNPEEQDVAIATMSPYSWLHMYSFPRRATYFFERYVTYFNDLPESIISEWKETYLTSLRKATLRAGGKRLVIHNPPDSARIKPLLELFPNAKFIHIYRNPYHVFRSTQHLHRVVLQGLQFQEIDHGELENWVLQGYSQLMQKLLADKTLIPAGNLVEVKYEELDKEPLAQLRKVYETLSLPGFAEAEPAFRGYLDSIAGYQKVAYKQLDDSIVTKINQKWRFAFDALGYELIEPAGKEKSTAGKSTMG